MQYSVIALLDNESTAYFTDLMNDIPGKRMSDIYLPHITIAAYDESPAVDELIAWTQQIVENRSSFAVRYEVVALFLKRCLAAIPSFSSELWSLYYEHQQRFGELTRDWGLFKKDIWFPHTSICLVDEENATEMLGQLESVYRPRNAKVTTVCVSGFDGTGFELIAKFPLI